MDHKERPTHGRDASRRKFLKTAGGAVTTTATLAGCTGGRNSSETQTANNSSGSDDGATVGSSSSNSGLADEITAYTLGGAWGRKMKKAYLEPFEEEYGVTVNVREYGSPNQLISKIRAGSVDAHVVEQNDPTVYSGVKDDIWQPLRPENIPHLDDIVTFDPRESPFDPGERFHHIPQNYGGYGLVYNYEQLDEPSSWFDLYSSDLEGNLTHCQFIEAVVALASVEAGIDFNSLDGGEKIDKVWERVAEQNNYVREWWDSGSTAQQLFSTEAALAGSFWYGRTQVLREEENIPIRYTLPEEGAPAWVDSWTVPQGISDPQRKTAEKLLDYLLRPEPSQHIAELIGYAQTVEVPDAPEAYKTNPDVVHNDRVKAWDHSVLNEHKKNWQKEFQSVIRQ